MRETFILYFEKEYSYKEIAAELNISYANARKRISQARAILREQHQEYEAGVSPSDGTPLKTQNKPETSTLVETRTFVSSGERVWSKPVDRTSHTPVAGSPQTPLRKGGFRKPPLLEGGVWGGSSATTFDHTPGEPSEASEKGEAFEPINVEEPVMTRGDSQSHNCNLPKDRTPPKQSEVMHGLAEELVMTPENSQCHHCHQPNERAFSLSPPPGSSQQSSVPCGCGQNLLTFHGPSQWSDPPKPPLKRGAKRPPLSQGGVWGGSRDQLLLTAPVPPVGAKHLGDKISQKLTNVLSKCFARECISMWVCCPNPRMMGGATDGGRCPPYNATPNHSINADRASDAGVYEPFVWLWRVWADSGGLLF